MGWWNNCCCWNEQVRMLYQTSAIVAPNNCSCFVEKFHEKAPFFYWTTDWTTADFAPNTTAGLIETQRITTICWWSSWNCLIKQLQSVDRPTAFLWATNCSCVVEHLQKLHQTTAVFPSNNSQKIRSCFTEQFFEQLQLARRPTAVASSNSYSFFIEQLTEQLLFLHRTTTIVS